jgi:hypothetical protein
MLAAEILVHLKQELKSEMENWINNLFLVGFNLFFINFIVYAWRIRFGNRTPTNVLKVYFFLLKHYTLQDFLKSLNIRHDV